MKVSGRDGINGFTTNEGAELAALQGAYRFKMNQFKHNVIGILKRRSTVNMATWARA